ncbi:fumarate reductase subunit FrdD [Hoyosella subflava]|uniref:Fumarate reductase subunit D n=1 Tax=Hoyosella subflava (strain DSM 45089 / JCM 17490 / NBRC 109087 / DQS3-9A1) TaxID=443218 RepID=F6EKS4_HOYSD|nr:fumarate reductase subunit FrdD [Hoyosella subflava]AEF41404.1 Fumarate reductase subunit D [Hoyosella subflava DQS3-9A1]
MTLPVENRRARWEPIAWLLFSAGGMSAALFLPVLVLLFGVLAPLGVVSPSHEHLYSVLSNPLTMLVLFGVLSLSAFHWAHRFRHIMSDGFRLRPLAGVISIACYGVAALGTVVIGAVILQV